jgi:hypothetical protein
VSLFIVVWHYAKGAEINDQIRQEHRTYLRGLAARDAVRSSGRITDGTGAILIYEAPDRETVDSFVADDPFNLHHVIDSYDVYEWAPLLGPFAEAPRPASSITTP